MYMYIHLYGEVESYMNLEKEYTISGGNMENVRELSWISWVEIWEDE